MANNILDMADRIGDMAEYILNMADLVSFLGGGNSENHYLGVALTGPVSGTSEVSTTVPSIVLSNDNVTSYTLYASNYAYFPSGGTLKMNVIDFCKLVPNRYAFSQYGTDNCQS